MRIETYKLDHFHDCGRRRWFWSSEWTGLIVGIHTVMWSS